MVGVDIFYTTFNNILKTQGPEKFWWSVLTRFNSIMKKRFPLKEGKETATAADFMDFFSKLNNDSPKPAILIIDEASNLFYNNQIANVDLSTEFICALRDLKDDRVNYCLHALVLVGTESVKDALAICRPNSTTKISPFSVESIIPTVRFTLSEVKDLLHQFSKERNLHLDIDNIAGDIYNLTLGHKGLVGLCGYYLETFVAVNKSSVTLVDWEKHVFLLSQHAAKYATYFSIIQSLGNLDQNQRDILGMVLRNGTHTVPLVSRVLSVLTDFCS